MKIVLGIVIFFAFCLPLSAQYTLNGYATQDACNAYTLTQAAANQNGSVWNNNKINITQSFDYKFDVNLGSNDLGADGIVFVLQPISTSVGSSGGGLGYLGVAPAVGVTIDTYQNTGNNDPLYDHIAIQLNGDIGHTSTNNIAGPVTAINGNDNIEDGLWHSLRIVWDATTKTFSAYMDGSLRVTVVKDFVTDVFGGDPLVYWGFTGSTGGANNHQRFRTALNPSFHFSATQKRCANEPIQFFDSTVSFTAIAKFYWDFGDGSPIDSVNLNPIHIYPVANDYTVKQRVIGADGCETTNTQTIRIGSFPIANFSVTTPNCNLNAIPFTDQSTVAVGTINSWLWDFGAGNTSTLQNPVANYTQAGPHDITLTVKTIEGCESSLFYKTINVFFSPTVDFTFSDSVCLGQPTSFNGSYTAVGGLPVNAWNWNMDNAGLVFPNILNPSFTFLTPGNHEVFFAATSTGSTYCIGSITKTVYVRDKPHAAIKNPVICPKMVTILEDSSYTSDGIAISSYWWDLGNGQFSAQKNPTITYTGTGAVIIRHVVIDARGCISDTLKQTVYFQTQPVVKFGNSNPVCYGLPVKLSDSTAGTINKWSWVYNNAVVSTQQTHSIAFTVTNPTIALVVTSAMGCVSDTGYKTLFVNPVPDVTMNFKDACKNAVVNFNASDNSGTVTSWQWLFGDGASVNAQNTQHAYTANGTYNVKLIASASTGCYSGSLQKDITIYSTNVTAGNDTIAAAGQPLQLNATGGLSYSWTPALPLSNPNIANPLATLTATQTFTVRAFTPEGCESFDTVTVKIYKGPDIYLPNAFTPNGDGLNDVFRGTLVGIKQFNYLKIFSRWGELVFSTTDYRKGWDGLQKGKVQNNGVYIVIASGIDFLGNAIEKKQTVMLIH
ncbi:MAG: PKD domain-containing protein [Ferruginibacter sp.]